MADFQDYYDENIDVLRGLKQSLAAELEGARAELKETTAEAGSLQIELNLSKARRDSATSDQAFNTASEKIGQLEPKLLVRGNRVKLLTEQIADITRSLALLDFELDRQRICADGEITSQAYEEFKRAYSAYILLGRQFHESYTANLARAKSLGDRADRLGISRSDYLIKVGGPGGVSTSFAQWLGDLAIDGIR